MSSESFIGKTVLITGKPFQHLGASSGFGAGTAVEFAKKGAYLVLGGRNAENLADTKRNCLAAGLKENQVISIIGDIVDDGVLQQYVDSAIEKFGSLDILVNNAGTAFDTSPLTMKMEDFDRTHNVNLRSAVALSLKALPHLIKVKGNIVNVSSICSTRPFENMIAYCMSKAGLDMFTKSLAFEVAPYGVRVNSVNPGAVATNICREMKMDIINTDMPKNLLDIHRIGRAGEIIEVANAILFLSSNHSSFITGQTLQVCGGAGIPGVTL